jgi:hypothetical protein
VTEVPIEALREAIRDFHGCDSTFVESVPAVGQFFSDRTVWEGTVAVFDLIGHPTAKRAYAWSSEVPGSDRRRFLAVLHSPTVASPVDAVRASIAADFRDRLAAEAKAKRARDGGEGETGAAVRRR